MRVLVVGAQGQLGTSLTRHVFPDAYAASRADLDIRREADVKQILHRLQPDVLINAAAYTAVDQAETQREACYQLNVDAVSILAQACEQLGATLVHISSDYVFGGDEGRCVPYTEQDQPAPQSIYAKSKLDSETAAFQCERHFVVRTCGVYGHRTSPAGPNNFVETMLRLAIQLDQLKIVDDQRCTPTSAKDLATAIGFLCSTQDYGLYHVVNQGETTWFEFAREIFKRADITIPVQRITTEQFNAAADRPRYSVLDTTKYHQLGGPVMPSWQAAVASYLGSRPPS